MFFKRIQNSTSLILILVLLVTSVPCSVLCDENLSSNTIDTWNTVADSYTFCFPLVLMDATMKKFTNTVNATSVQAPVNQLIHSQTLATPDEKNVVTPNVDTVYSEAFLNLSGSAYVFVKPPTDRFCSVQVMDAYTNTVTVIGSGGQGDPSEKQVCLLTGKDYHGIIPDGMIRISVPTDIAWILVRTLENGTSDQQNVSGLQKQMQLAPLNAYMSTEPYVPPNGSYHQEYDYVPIDHVLNMSPDEFFNTANNLMERNPPSAADVPIVKKMTSIHVGPELSFDESLLGDNVSSQWNEMLKTLKPRLSSAAATYLVSLGSWNYSGDPIGDFGTAYGYRASIALNGLGANPTYVAIYPETGRDLENQSLSGSSKYRLHFDQGMLPPVEPGGFWSVTAYGSDDFLIANPINRYCINDRSHLTSNSDGSVDILLQATEPDQDQQHNWLPVSDDEFHLVMRIYLPQNSVREGNWSTPDIVRVT
jgi:hypothetical protein